MGNIGNTREYELVDMDEKKRRGWVLISDDETYYRDELEKMDIGELEKLYQISREPPSGANRRLICIETTLRTMVLERRIKILEEKLKVA